MAKYVVMARLTVFDEDFEMYGGIEELFEDLNEEGHKIIVISHDIESLRIMKDIFKAKFEFEVICTYRKKIREYVDEDNASSFVLIGSSDEDLILAANKRILIINPGWSIQQEEKPARYGITLECPNQLFEAIRLIDNQSRWYFELNVDQNTTVLALTSANTYNRVATEREVLDGFENLLKYGDRNYFNTLYFHLISGVMKSPVLRKIDIWGTFPTSSGSINAEVEELKERCRYLTGKRMKEPLFIRHLPVDKSRHTPHEKRLREGCSKHFDSIILNPYYAKKVKGKVVCVIDDYITNGISFEAARNILFKAGASRVICIALGRYKKGQNGIYQHEIYNLRGDVTEENYQYSLNSKRNLIGNYDDGAREEVRYIHEILYG